MIDNDNNNNVFNSDNNTNNNNNNHYNHSNNNNDNIIHHFCVISACNVCSMQTGSHRYGSRRSEYHTASQEPNGTEVPSGKLT